MTLLPRRLFSFFFFNDTATTEIYTLSLHDALPICEDRTIQAEHQACHSDSISLTEPSQDFVKYTPVRGERLGYVSHDDRRIIPPTVGVLGLYQLLCNWIKIRNKGSFC